MRVKNLGQLWGLYGYQIPSGNRSYDTVAGLVISAAITNGRAATPFATGIRGTLTPFSVASRSAGAGSRVASAASRSTIWLTDPWGTKGILRRPSPRTSSNP